MRKIDIEIGKKYGRLTILNKEGFKTYLSGQRKEIVLCECECGNLKKFIFHEIKSGDTKSCGCFRKEIVSKHGLYNSKEYKTWKRIIQICTNPKNPDYFLYKQNNIGLYPKWLDFNTFLKDMGKTYKNMIFSRIDKLGNFEPKNCEWATGKKETGRRYIKDRTLLKQTNDRKGDSLSVEYRYKTLDRDNRKCKINNNECNGKLEVHHIFNWRDYPELRYDLNNLITLCHHHHPRGKKNESRLSPYFIELIKQ